MNEDGAWERAMWPLLSGPATMDGQHRPAVIFHPQGSGRTALFAQALDLLKAGWGALSDAADGAVDAYDPWASWDERNTARSLGRRVCPPRLPFLHAWWEQAAKAATESSLMTLLWHGAPRPSDDPATLIAVSVGRSLSMHAGREIARLRARLTRTPQLSFTVVTESVADTRYAAKLFGSLRRVVARARSARGLKPDSSSVHLSAQRRRLRALLGGLSRQFFAWMVGTWPLVVTWRPAPAPPPSAPPGRLVAAERRPPRGPNSVPAGGLSAV